MSEEINISKWFLSGIHMLFTVWKILIVILTLHCIIVIARVHYIWPNIEFITGNASTAYLKSSCHPHSTGGFNSPYFCKDHGMWLSLQAIVVSFFLQICLVWILTLKSTVLVYICVVFIISSIKIQRHFFQTRLLLSNRNPTYFP